MDPFETELRASLKAMTSREPAVPAYSTVTGKLIEAGELDADYWWRNMRNPVLFRQAAEAAIGDGFNTFVELGAHPVLTGPVRACLAHCGREGTVVGSLHREEKDRDYISRSLADLHLAGVAVDWARVAPPNWNFVELPRQRFERKTFWSESEESQDRALLRAGASAARLPSRQRCPVLAGAHQRRGAVIPGRPRRQRQRGVSRRRLRRADAGRGARDAAGPGVGARRDRLPRCADPVGGRDPVRADLGRYRARHRRDQEPDAQRGRRLGAARIGRVCARGPAPNRS